VRVYLPGAQIRLIENKVGNGQLSPQQKERHAALAKLGRHVEMVSAVTAEDAATQAVELVRGWLHRVDDRAA
jgi:hypothetical protein